MGRPRRHDQSTERELLAAAEALLAEGGAEALSVRRVADAAGTTARAIYSVFGGKDGLLQALYREAFDALSADLDALPRTGDPRADLVAMGAAGFRGWAKARPELFRLAFVDTAAPLGRADVAAGVAAFDRMRMQVRRCAEAGLLPAAREAEAALSFHAMCEGLASLEARGRFPLLADHDSAVLWRHALEAVVDGFGARPVRF